MSTTEWADAAFGPHTAAGDAVTTRGRRYAHARRSSPAVAVATVAAAAGLLVVAIGMDRARSGAGGGTGLLWLGMVTIYAPAAWMLMRRDLRRGQRLLIVTVLGVALLGVKWMLEPDGFRFHDELIHVAAQQRLEDTGRLYEPNSLLPATARYPVLQIMTGTVRAVTGLPIVVAGYLVVLISRLLVVLSLFLVADRALRSHRAAGLAVVLYAANPHFVYFSTQFAYQSLAVGLAGASVLLVAEAARRRSRWWMAAAAGAIVATALTHHLTGAVLAAFLVLWAAAHRTGFGEKEPVGLRWVTAAAAVASLTTVGWAAVSWTVLRGYLGPVFQSAWDQLVGLLDGERPSRRLFQDYAGDSPALWAQAVTVLAAVAVLGALVAALPTLWSRRRSFSPLATAMIVVGLGYPVLLAVRFAPTAAELADRASTFVFIGIAVAVAVALTVALDRFPQVPVVVAALVLMTATFVGNTILGSGPEWARVPGPYLVSADIRSVDTSGLAAAAWMSRGLPDGSRVGADRIQRLIAAAYGEQRPVTGVADREHVSWVVFTERMDPGEWDALERMGVEYLVIDRRQTTGLPRVGVFWENGEPGSFEHDEPLSLPALDKFATVPGFATIYDSGDIRIYEVIGR
jgi:hypothetical protein